MYIIFFLLKKGLRNLLSNLHKTNAATFVIALICMVILYIVKHFINERYKAKMFMPVPIEFLVVNSFNFTFKKFT